MIEDNNINAKIMNLWKNKEQEKAALIPKEILAQINNLKETHHTVALGRWQEKALIRHKIKCIYLPHPASWKPNDRSKLIKGLIKLNAER